VVNEWITPEKFYIDKRGGKVEVLYWNWNHIWIKRELSERKSRMKWGTFKKMMKVAA
jgi:hypothetical protein